MELLCFTLVAVSSILGILKWNPLKLAINAILMVAAALFMTLSAGVLLHHTVPSADDNAKLISEMKVQELVPYEVMDQPPTLPEETGTPNGNSSSTEPKKRAFSIGSSLTMPTKPRKQIRPKHAAFCG